MNEITISKLKLNSTYSFSNMARHSPMHFSLVGKMLDATLKPTLEGLLAYNLHHSIITSLRLGLYE